MRTVYGMILVSMLLLVTGCAQKINDPADVQAIRASMDDFAKAVNAGDADGVAAVMTDMTLFAEENIPALVGKEAITSFYQDVFSQSKLEFSAPVEDVRVVGDLAVARGTWTDKLTPLAEGVAPVDASGSWIVVFARQSDGSWKWDWVVPNSDQPLPGATASGEDEGAIYQIERDWIAAMVKKDTATVGNILADEFVSISAGVVKNKRQVLADVRSRPSEIESATNSDMRAMVFGDTAFVTGLYTEKSTTGGKDTSRKLRYSEIFAKRDDRWQCLSSYTVAAP